MSLKALKLATISIGASTIFLETSQGIITHIDALRLGITGRILCVILYYVF
jgi:ribosomal protein S8